jgi:hypothetical protein
MNVRFHPARSRLPARLWRDQSAVALIEFAYALPLILALGFAGLETANLAAAHLKVSQIGMMVADNSGRVITRIDEADINEVFDGARQIGTSLDFNAHGRIVLSSLQDNNYAANDPKHGQMINWQRCMGALTTIKSSYGIQGKGKTDSSLQGMGKTGNMIASVPGTAVMFVEISYDYQPLLTGIIPGRRIRYESAFNVRERTEHDITNTKSLALNSC